ncbi:MAG: Gfo/Idh/MocA family oxidoreductase [Armatimonadota bacterium]|nr:Gfo/Idh/MocA family oxidoreductase [Armatimonadota bacterium]
MSSKKRYVQVGIGGRGEWYYQTLINQYREHCELVGACDSNEGRLKMHLDWARAKGVEVKGYSDKEFDKMIAETKPDRVIITTRDCYHDEYVCRALELGCDAITEKPMTTDEHKCQRIIDTQRRTGKKVTVTFNYRYAPPRLQVKDLLMSGVVGDVMSVDYHYLLAYPHGGDYFRRWHRNKANSGGLMVHKATHHFDLVNWFLSSVPETVFAKGSRKFYTPRQAERFGLVNRSERCMDCADAKRCKFYFDLKGNEYLRKIYYDNEQYDGYVRDRCVFSDTIDIEDRMDLVVQYQSGASMSYSLSAYMPWEGYYIVFNGSKGRLEHMCQETVYISADGTVPGALKREGTWTRIFPHFDPAYEVEIWTGEGGHGGGDEPLLHDLFHPDPREDKYLCAADQRAGAYSILTGIAANRSMEQGREIRIDDLVQNIGMPVYPPMPSKDDAMTWDLKSEQ